MHVKYTHHNYNTRGQITLFHSILLIVIKASKHMLWARAFEYGFLLLATQLTFHLMGWLLLTRKHSSPFCIVTCKNNAIQYSILTTDLLFILNFLPVHPTAHSCNAMTSFILNKLLHNDLFYPDLFASAPRNRKLGPILGPILKPWLLHTCTSQQTLISFGMYHGKHMTTASWS